MIPPALSRSTNSSAERKLFGLLEQVTLPGAVAYHSLQLSRHEYKRVAEIDFLIVAPQGLLVVEVKGGRVRCQDGLWVYTDRFDQDHHSSEGPFKQASTAMFALESRLRSLVGANVGAALFGYAVATPDAALGVDSVEWEAADSWGPGDLQGAASLATAIRRSLDSWAQRSPGRTLKVDSGFQTELGRVLRPDFDRVPALRIRADQIDSAMEVLTEEQYAMLDLIEGSSRILYRGGAGTGKTFLAAETARREAARGRALLVCAGQGFATFLRSRLAGSGVEVRSIKQLEGISEPFDTLILDEAQDVMNFDDLDGLDRVLIGGLAEGRWRMFLDPNRQHGIVGRFETDALKLIESYGPVPATLSRNCRNTTPIVTQTRLLTAADIGKPNSGDGPAVDFVSFDTPDDQVSGLDSVIRGLRDEGLAGGMVTVLSPQDFGESTASKSKEAKKGRLVPITLDDRANWPVTHATFSSIGEFKGMENSAVVVVDLDRLGAIGGEAGINLLYVAMTRARAKLVVLVDESTSRELTRIVEHNLKTVEGLLNAD